MNDCSVGLSMTLRLALPLILMLSGCTLISDLRPETASPKTSEKIERQQQDQKKIEELKAEKGQIVVTPPMKPEPPQVVAFQATSASLIGQSVASVERDLGRPNSIRDEKPALVYEYRAPNCALDVIFFMDIERQEFRALSYDVRAGGATDRSLQACMQSIKTR